MLTEERIASTMLVAAACISFVVLWLLWDIVMDYVGERRMARKEMEARSQDNLYEQKKEALRNLRKPVRTRQVKTGIRKVHTGHYTFPASAEIDWEGEEND